MAVDLIVGITCSVEIHAEYGSFLSLREVLEVNQTGHPVVVKALCLYSKTGWRAQILDVGGCEPPYGLAAKSAQSWPEESTPERAILAAISEFIAKKVPQQAEVYNR